MRSANQFRPGYNKTLIACLTSLTLIGCGGDGDDNSPETSSLTDRGPRPLQMDWTMTSENDGAKTIYQTSTSLFEPSRPFETAEPTNLLPTVYENLRDSSGDIIPNTLPSTAENPYNLHDDPTVTTIDPRSPRQDLELIINDLKTATDSADFFATSQEVFPGGTGVPVDPRRGGIERSGADAGTINEPIDADIDFDKVQLGIDILEGNDIDRAYSGIPLLNYNGPNKVKSVDPDTRTVTVHQVWARARIMSDTAYIDPSAVMDDPWTIRYEIDVVHAGHEDFAPLAMFFDDPNDNNGMRLPHVSMDQTFFPMAEGKRYVFEIKMPPGRYWNLTYHWGWRAHPPRIQAVENALKMVMGKPIVEWETDAFGVDPRSSQAATWDAIDMIGDLAPAKRMWKALNALKAKGPAIDVDSDFYARFNSNTSEADLVAELEASFDDWKDRTKLPRGVPDPKPGIHQTLFYANNSIYGTIHSVRDGPNLMAQETFDGFQERGDKLKIQFYNADYFPHAYMNVDFGGRRGWENTFQNTIPTGGQGPWFTFGRVYWSPNLMKPALIPPATRPGALQMQSSGLLDTATGSRTIALPEPGEATGSNGLVEGLRSLFSSNENIKTLPETNDSKYFTWGPLQHPGREFMSAANTVEGLGEHEVEIEFRFDPAQRLRFYQFDPLHHDQAILSIH